MGFSEFDAYDGLGLAELVRNKQVKPEELLEECLARSAKVNTKLNAIVHSAFDNARLQITELGEDGPFRGVPFLAKDLGGTVKGMPITFASHAYKNLVARADSTFFERIRKAGFIIFGKTNTPEFGQLAVTEPRLFGPCRNPWNTNLSPGGSSGGAAAAVAAGILPIAHASDGGGSIRGPASCTGLFGLKPSRGRQPFGPRRSEMVGHLAVDHVITRTVRDSAALLDATNGKGPATTFSAPPPKNSYLSEVDKEPGKLRVAVYRGTMLGDNVHPECQAALDHSAKLLADLGHHVEDAEPKGINYREVAKNFLMLWSAIAATAHSWMEEEKGAVSKASDFEPCTWGMIKSAHVLSAWDVAQAVSAEGELARIMTDFFTSYDLLLTPTLSRPPVKIGELKPTAIDEAILLTVVATGNSQLVRNTIGQLAKKSFQWTAFCAPFNMTGQPAISVPLYWTKDNLPIGTQLVARFGEEDTLFQVAGQLERAQPWFQRRPPIWSGNSGAP